MLLRRPIYLYIRAQDIIARSVYKNKAKKMCFVNYTGILVLSWVGLYRDPFHKTGHLF